MLMNAFENLLHSLAVETCRFIPNYIKTYSLFSLAANWHNAWNAWHCCATQLL